jgi:anti-sigma factor RsiW
MTHHLTCTDALDLVEPIAAGDIDVTAAAREHIETCPRCASALASARRIEGALVAREAPPAPPRFTPGVLARIRRERWRSEQHVDRLFNLAIAVAVLLMAGGAAALLNVNAVLAGAAAGWNLLTAASINAVKTAAPALATYMASAGLLVSALGMWWWAERRLSL